MCNGFDRHSTGIVDGHGCIPPQNVKALLKQPKHCSFLRSFTSMLMTRIFLLLKSFKSEVQDPSVHATAWTTAY